MFFIWFFSILFSILVILFAFTLVCYLLTFYSPKKRDVDVDNLQLPRGANYEDFREQMVSWIKDIRSKPYETFSIKSFDGLTLKARYYEYAKNSPIEIVFHGYRGNCERDLSGAVERCFALKRSVIIVDHRASGESEGRTITFGVNEVKDCLSWVNYVVKRFDNEVEIILGGVSMGGATVVMASSQNLPKNVKYIVSDCAYSSIKEIICKVIRDMKLPPKIVFPFIKLSAKLFGNFNLCENSPEKAVKNAKVPIVFIHGDKDGFVPSSMSETLYELCPTKKSLKVIKGAEHGLAYPVSKDEYVNAIKEFES